MKYQEPFCFLLKTDYEAFRDSEYTESGRVWNVGPNAETVPLYLQSDCAFELYEALRECLEHMEWSTPQGKKACDRARAVLAKVEG